MVGQFCQDIDLSLKIFDFVGLVNSFLFVYFDGNFLVGTFVKTHPDNPVGTFSKFPINLVVVHFLFGLNGHNEVEKFALGRPFLLSSLHFLHFEFIDVVGSKLIFHEIVHELCINFFSILIFLLERLLCPLRVGRSTPSYLVYYFPWSRVSFFIIVQLPNIAVSGCSSFSKERFLRGVGPAMSNCVFSCDDMVPFVGRLVGFVRMMIYLVF